ncbi:MAG: hypothetical protein SFY92_07840 [Verrucomicrobiae bacterium]|nr:hypothetical protein [Verrucomicrobiae bacterium]
MKFLPVLLTVFLAIAGGLRAQSATNAPVFSNGSTAAQAEFMRIEKVDGKRKFQMVIATYELGKFPGRKVALIAAVHIASPEYYALLQKRFKKYDAVLMEGIDGKEKFGKKGALLFPPSLEVFAQSATPAKKASSPEKLSNVHDIQETMSRAMGFEHQLRSVDYRQPNFVYPDMSMKELQKRLGDKGVDYLMPEEQLIEPLLPMAQSLLGGGARRAEASPMQNIFRNLMAELILRMDFEKALAGDDPAQVKRRDYFNIILKERNEKVIEALRAKLDEGARSVGVFYGAMHLPDIARTLREDFGARKISEEWITAWDL